MPIADAGAPSKGYQPIIGNFKLLANDLLGGVGGPAVRRHRPERDDGE
jgi:hypothetical protein